MPVLSQRFLMQRDLYGEFLNHQSLLSCAHAELLKYRFSSSKRSQLSFFEVHRDPGWVSGAREAKFMLMDKENE